MKIFTLNLDISEALKDRGERKLDEWEKGRIVHHHKIGINDPDFGITIRTDGLTIEQIVKKIKDNL